MSVASINPKLTNNHPAKRPVPDPRASAYDLHHVVSAKNKVVGLWKMLTGYRWLYLIALVSLGLAALARVGTFYLIQYLVDSALVSPNLMQILPLLAAGFIGLAMLQGGFTFLSGKLAAQTAEGITLRLRDYLYDHLQRLTFSYHDTMQTGELVQRSSSDVDALRRLFAEQLIGIGRIITLFSITFTALLLLNVRLALISVIAVPIVVGISIYLFQKLEKRFNTYQEQDAIVSSHLQENLSGVRVVKAFARQQFEIDRFETSNKTWYNSGIGVLNLHAIFWPSTDLICSLQMIVGYYVGATMAINGTITTGEYLAYAGLVVQIIWPIRNLGRIIAQMSTGFVAFERVSEILRQDREQLTIGSHTPTQPVNGAIRFKNVSFAYTRELKKEKSGGSNGSVNPNSAPTASVQPTSGDPIVLEDLTFDVAPGEVIALMGPAGSGKSSLINLLPRFYDYTAGSITLDGVELRNYPRAYLRSQIGIVQQEPFLFSRTLRENISYGVGRDVTDEEIETAARSASIHEVILTFPKGYDTIVGERGVTLSGGQKQRITIARTLLKNPRILIMDDATSAVDTETEAAIRAAQRTLMADRTTLIIAHRVQSVMHADRIIVLDAGRIVQHGTHSELLAADGVYKQVYDLQGRVEDELQHEIESADKMTG